MSKRDFLKSHCCNCIYEYTNTCRRYPPVLLDHPSIKELEGIDLKSWQYPPIGGGQLACGEFIRDKKKEKTYRTNSKDST